MSHALRAPLVARLGTAGFQLLYVAVSFTTLGSALIAFRAAPLGQPLWSVGNGLWAISTVIMLAASILLLGSFAIQRSPHPEVKSLPRSRRAVCLRSRDTR